ncbi:Gti1/Pac2 family-domain-containing protein [Coprinopsis sp. MPI-PUGE-AT-0042]|nr:Gti1/Pac2 family-domain-containing protein [Coprinopsis sp. MPI-PUGE-AT-0042]
MQRATCTGLRVRSPADARIIFHAVVTNVLPMVTRRLDSEERSLIQPGSVYVWEERGPHAELTGVGIERWTDGIRWGPSRVREGFLFYHEKSQQSYSDHLYGGEKLCVPNSSELSNIHPDSGMLRPQNPRTVLIKQTYTVFVDTPRGQRKWHLIAYFTEESLDRLRTIDDIPQLAYLEVPSGKYKSARSAKGRPEHLFQADADPHTFGQLEYVSYAPSYRESPPQATHPVEVTPKRSYTWVDTSSTLNERQFHLPPQRVRQQYSPSFSSDSGSDSSLAPLEYLKTIPPPRRHPIDEKTLMLFTSSL